MKKIKLLLLFFVVMIAGNIASQTLQGTVYSSEGYPLSDAVVSSSGVESVQTDQNGWFLLSGLAEDARIRVWAPGFFSQELAWICWPTPTSSLTATATATPV